MTLASACSREQSPQDLSSWEEINAASATEASRACLLSNIMTTKAASCRQIKQKLALMKLDSWKGLSSRTLCTTLACALNRQCA